VLGAEAATADALGAGEPPAAGGGAANGPAPLTTRTSDGASGAHWRPCDGTPPDEEASMGPGDPFSVLGTGGATVGAAGGSTACGEAASVDAPLRTRSTNASDVTAIPRSIPISSVQSAPLGLPGSWLRKSVTRQAPENIGRREVKHFTQSPCA
jgi:hypothetical protein